ncbi:MAG: trigger factor, partial [Thermotoga sp.]
MEKKEIERDKNVVLYEFVFDEKEVSSFEDVVTARLNRSMTVPGFRKGKVPKTIFKMRLGEEFNGYVLDEAADKILEKMEKEKLFISPIMKDYEFKDGNLIVKIEVHEKPRVSFEDFSEIEVEKVKEDSVIEKYVEKRLEELREKHALVEPKDGEAEHGDLVRVKMKVSLGDKVLDEKEYEYILKEDDDRPFVKEIVGKKKGDVVKFSREFKDKKYDYEVEILQVYSRTLMDISDELARTVSNEFETLEQLKEHLTKEGKEIYDVEMKENLREQVLEKLPEVTNLDISDKT